MVRAKIRKAAQRSKFFVTLRRVGLRSPVVAARSGKGRAVIWLLSGVYCLLVFVGFVCFSAPSFVSMYLRVRVLAGSCVCQSECLSVLVLVCLCTCGAVRLSVLVFVLAGPCGFVGRLPHSVIFGQNVVLFFETRREVRWRIEPYQKADVRYRIFVLLQKIGRIG